jgi:hypothetical protein
MKRVILFLFGMSLYYSLFATSLKVSDMVSGSWTADTIIVEGNLVVPAGEQLIVAPGTLVLFQSYYRIDVLGSIHAVGSNTDSIYFTINDTTNFFNQIQGRGGWSGIRFRQLSPVEDSSLFSYCRFEFGKATQDSINSFGGAIFVDDFDKVAIRNCVFYHNYSYYSGGAVYLKLSDAVLTGCKFISNYSGNSAGIVYGYGGGICCISGSPDITYCEFSANKSTGVGGGASFDGSDPVFSHNIMKGNYSGLGGALGVLRCAPQQTINNLLIADNEAAFFGGGICCIRSFPVFSNITLAENSSIYGGAFYCNDSAAPSMYNSIMWGNIGLGNSVYIWDVRSAPNFYYCNIEGDTSSFEGSGAQQGYHGIYLNNINEDPAFIGYGNYPYMLLDSSGCINSGTPDAGFLNLPPYDLRGIDRIVDGRIDQGAYEFDGTTATQHIILNDKKLLAYPNPFTSEVSILLPLSSTTNGSTSSLITAGYLNIYDLEGRIVKVINVLNGKEVVNWNCLNSNNNLIAPGSYFIKYNNGAETFCIKVIKL